MKPARWKWVKLGSLIVGMAGVVGVLQALGVCWRDLTPDQVRAYVLSFGWWAPLMYTLLYAQPIIPLPASVMSMAGGLSFGVARGFVIALAAAMIRACGQFLIARGCGREAVATILKGRLATLDQSLGQKGFWAVLWIRLVPNLPYDFQNFGLGFSQVSFGPFALGTLLALIPGIFLWVYVGHTLTDATQLWKIVVILIGLAACWYLHHRYRSRHVRVPS
jgi:uncharacterized membrane protein YdjX (TVP38/TMEM64 family)